MNDTSHVFLARHGRTALNAEGRLRGLANPPLDDIGIAEATRLGHALASTQITLVLSSPLDRAATTARIVADTVGVEHRVDDRFNDRDYGPWTGHLRTDVITEWGSVDDAPGVEPTSDVLARVLPALDDLTASPTRIAIITHDAVIRPLIQAIDPARRYLKTPTGSWNDLVRTTAGWVIRSIDNVPS